jgi:phosphopantothenoylcysteine decarboxylase/phosphopantothenate--cysteine ligase
MASITIRQLDESLKQQLRLRAASHGRSMEDEVRTILRAAAVEPAEARPVQAVTRRSPSRSQAYPLRTSASC